MLELGPLQDLSKWLSYVVKHWGLTEAHGLVLRDLARGHTVDAIAARRGVKSGTVRTHLHEVFKRTGLERQTNLVRLALGKWSDEFEDKASPSHAKDQGANSPDALRGHLDPL